MFTVTKSIDTHFAHAVRGHSGLCNSIHGHTWKFEVSLKSETLDAEGFVLDFGLLKKSVLTPIDLALDHCTAIAEVDYAKFRDPMRAIGEHLQDVRISMHGTNIANEMLHTCIKKSAQVNLPDVKIVWFGSQKLAVFSFVPTSERLAEWLFNLTESVLASDVKLAQRVKVCKASVYETLAPVNSIATFSRE